MNTEMHPHNSNENPTTNNSNNDESILSQQPSTPEDSKTKRPDSLKSNLFWALKSLFGGLCLILGFAFLIIPLTVAKYEMPLRDKLYIIAIGASLLLLFFFFLMLIQKKN